MNGTSSIKEQDPVWWQHNVTWWCGPLTPCPSCLRWCWCWCWCWCCFLGLSGLHDAHSIHPLPQAAGYTIKVLEHHDVKGEFHKENYSEESGRVSRLHLSYHKTTEESDTFSGRRKTTRETRGRKSLAGVLTRTGWTELWWWSASSSMQPNQWNVHCNCDQLFI